MPVPKVILHYLNLELHGVEPERRHQQAETHHPRGESGGGVTLHLHHHQNDTQLQQVHSVVQVRAPVAGEDGGKAVVIERELSSGTDVPSPPVLHIVVERVGRGLLLEDVEHQGTGGKLNRDRLDGIEDSLLQQKFGNVGHDGNHTQLHQGSSLFSDREILVAIIVVLLRLDIDGRAIQLLGVLVDLGLR